MEEKKLTDEVVVAKNAITDEEIIKGLENWILQDCTARLEDLSNAFDLIRRLQYGYSSASKASEEWKEKYEKERKETAEKFARLVEFHSVATMKDNVEYFTISALALKEILHEEFGIPYDEICKELGGELK